ncbi:hypothetical protein [Rhodospirillum rubrum]|uniref:Uncharacterized protein n=1 Tax=Rhodospirillum rubrum (strain ATCC 11170 / ATH 1.1.1 / DSM 467 / LMG 4362 / NCIMB 8255 / S1) TaxID=269796 RepID=Q2RQ76_RHORT|nr:hypothetical protein [Rhodospirillum rubrum]ABC23719.1 hypothetical protein Rru_A2922 [Rhodospirillum rubrum ATCC 11170]AEO49458.1 hypothetical protein F11_14980 [Rhodospirillum rubrum F11]MBK5955395.1 hypothetical protein [Rhodospirillum rubrum]QXG79675.1 hypothetical protein KUL73_15060 [Rhodospirillum rubrum]HAP98923.1 hypothetical protein [Rhodospirillum rubrum]
MSELMLNQIQVLLTKLSEDVERMGDLSTEQVNNLLNMLDGLAAHVLGTKAVVAALVKKYPIDLADAEAWLAENTDVNGASYSDILDAARHLVTGEKPSKDLPIA